MKLLGVEFLSGFWIIVVLNEPQITQIMRRLSYSQMEYCRLAGSSCHAIVIARGGSHRTVAVLGCRSRVQVIELKSGCFSLKLLEGKLAAEPALHCTEKASKT